MQWAIEFIFFEDESLNQRLQRLITIVIKDENVEFARIYDIDATGKIGNDLTMTRNNINGPISIDTKQILVLIFEEGQIIELDLYIKTIAEYRIIVRDGASINLLGTGDTPPQDATGAAISVDLGLFNYDQLD